MSSKSFDYIVLGCGGIGSGAVYWLAKRAGSRVLGIEQFELGHQNGGSQDYSRIIRLYGYDEKLMPLTPYTYKAWGEVERESGLNIVTKTGGISWIPEDAPPEAIDFHNESVASMDHHNIPYQRLNATQLRERFPQFRMPDHCEAIYQEETGFVDPSRGNAAHQILARKHGATILENCPVESIESTDDGVIVVAGGQRYQGKKLIITAGAWVQRFLDQFDLDLRLTVTQEQVTYYKTPHLREFMPDRFPVFLIPTPIGGIYGFPIHGEVATKAAIDLTGSVTTPETRTFEPDVAIEEFQEAWLKENIPDFLGPKLYTKTCLYTMTRDRTFIIDHVPGHPQILVAVGAGHAFKFASLFGQILSQLALDGQTPHNISSLGFDRAAIVDPDFDSPVLNQIAARGF